jgi:FkbM family methyltransferase
MSHIKHVSITVDRNGREPAKATMVIDAPGDLIQGHILRSSDFYERPLLDLLAAVVTPSPLFIDVGANIGNHTIFMTSVTGARAVSFEPNAANYERLIRNAQASGVASRVTTRREAVGDRPGFCRSVHGEGSHNTGGAKVVEASPGQADTVPIVTLDFALRDVAPPKDADTVVKIDVEGMEVEVLRGMRATLERFRPLIVCEVSSDRNMVMVRNILQPLGYVVAAAMFKTPTLLLMTTERMAGSLDALAAQSWVGARCYVEYCRLFAVVKRAQKGLDALNAAFDAGT